MSYLNSKGYGSLGAVNPAQWDSKRYPGVAKPTSFESLALFKDLQTQVNRWRKYFGLSLIAVDGDLGPGTLAAVKDIGARLSYMPAAAYKSVDELAADADGTTGIFKGRADERGLGTPTPPISGGGTTTLPPPSMPNVPLTVPSTGIFSSLEPLAAGIPGGMTGLAIIGGGIVLLIAQKKGWFRGGKGRKAMRRAGRRRGTSF